MRELYQIEYFKYIINDEETPKDFRDSVSFYDDLGIYVICEPVDIHFDEQADPDGFYRMGEEAKIKDKSVQKGYKEAKVFSIFTGEGYEIGAIETFNYSKDDKISKAQIYRAIKNYLDNEYILKFVLAGYFENEAREFELQTDGEKNDVVRKIKDNVLEIVDQFANKNEIFSYEDLGLYAYKYPYPEQSVLDYSSNEIHRYYIFDSKGNFLFKFKSNNEGYFGYPIQKEIMDALAQKLSVREGNSKFQDVIINGFIANEKIYDDSFLGIGTEME